MATFHLTDDGTLDTVVACDFCGAEERFNFQDDNEPRGEDSSAAYDRFVEESCKQASEDHECASVFKTPVTADNYVDAAQALYWFCTNHHEGQSSEKYSILSARLKYSPAMSENGPDEDTEARDFYAELVGGGWDATDMLEAIDAAYLLAGL